MDVSKMSREEFTDWWWTQEQKRYKYCEYCEVNGKAENHKQRDCDNCGKSFCVGKGLFSAGVPYVFCTRKCVNVRPTSLRSIVIVHK